MPHKEGTGSNLSHCGPEGTQRTDDWVTLRDGRRSRKWNSCNQRKTGEQQYIRPHEKFSS